jgi:trigger factor
MKVQVEDLSAVKKRLTIEVPSNDVEKEVKAAYTELKGAASVPGFRKGNIPEKILRQKFAGQVMGDVTTRLVQKTYPEALKDRDITPVDSPEIELKKMEEGGPFVYSATVEVSPTLDVKGYRAMALQRKSVWVTDKEVEEGLKRLRQSHAEFKDVERPAALGDMVVMDFEGTVEGKPVEGARAVDYSIVLGKGQLIQGFDESLAGAEAGSTVEVRTTFPEAHRDEGIAGKEAVFDVRVKAVKQRVLPALDDEFAKDLNSENLEELRGKVKHEIEKAKQREEKERVRAEALEKLINENPFEVPTSVVERHLSVILSAVEENKKLGIVDPRDKALGLEKLKERYREAAVKRAKADILLDTIERKEKIEVTDTELEEYIKDMAEKTGSTPEAVRGRVEKEGTVELIRDRLKREKVFDILTESRIRQNDFSPHGN